MKMSQRFRSAGVIALGSASLLSFFALRVFLGPSVPYLADYSTTIRRLLANDSTTIRRFQLLFHDSRVTTSDNSRWLGVPIQKCPMDLATFQEILYDTKPDVLIEAGTFQGGSALFFASIMDLLKRGRVITIDPVDQGRPPHPRITYLQGLSTAPEIVAAVKSLIQPNEAVMVILDSDHNAANVLKEVRTYGPLVTEEGYLVVEDTALSGHPIWPGTGPGPWEAVDEFI